MYIYHRTRATTICSCSQNTAGIHEGCAGWLLMSDKKHFTLNIFLLSYCLFIDILDLCISLIAHAAGLGIIIIQVKFCHLQIQWIIIGCAAFLLGSLSTALHGIVLACWNSSPNLYSIAQLLELIKKLRMQYSSVWLPPFTVGLIVTTTKCYTCEQRHLY